MKFNNVLRGIAVAAAMSVAAPSARASAEKLTKDQRACVVSVLGSSDATDADVQKCVAAGGGDDPEKARQTLAPDSTEARQLFVTLEARMNENSPVRPKGVTFADVKRSLKARPDLLFSLNAMEKTGGQPDVVAVDGNTFVFGDVSPESPEGRRNLDYNQTKAMAEAAGYEVMDEATYRELQGQIPLDTKTLSYLLTDPAILATGFALRGGRDGGGVMVARYWADVRDPSYGCRGLLRVPKS